MTTLDGEQQLGAEVWVDKTGGNSKTVHFVELSETAMAAALVQGRIDAAMMTGSYFAQARNDVELLGNADAAIALRETAHWANG